MGVTNFIDVFVGGELQRPSFSQVKTQVECVATNLKENKKNAAMAPHWRRCVRVCAPSDVAQSELGLSRVNKWYQHGLRVLQRLHAFARSRLIPTPFSCFLLIKKVGKKGKRKNNAIMQARGWLFISLTFNTVSYIYFYDVTDGGKKTKNKHGVIS